MSTKYNDMAKALNNCLKAVKDFFIQLFKRNTTIFCRANNHQIYDDKSLKYRENSNILSSEEAYEYGMLQYEKRANLKIGLKYLLQSANQGHKIAFSEIGIINYRERNNVKESEKWFIKAEQAKCLSAKAAYYYGLLLYIEKGNFKESLKYLRKSAEEGFELAYGQLGSVLYHMKLDVDEAERWFKKAEEVDCLNALQSHDYGILLIKDKGDGKKGNKYLNRSIEDVINVEKSKLCLNDNTLGIALSGGGIRSASFGLGVLQAMMNHGVLQKTDYLSTVSGGGYIGSSLTWFRNKFGDKQMFLNPQPFGGKEKTIKELDEFNFIRYLRQHGNYLFPGNSFNPISTLGVLFRNLIFSSFTYFLMFLLFVTLLIIISRVSIFNDIYMGGKEMLRNNILNLESSNFSQDINNVTNKNIWVWDENSQTRHSIVFKTEKFITSNNDKNNFGWEKHSLFRFSILLTILTIIISLLLLIYSLIKKKKYSHRILFQKWIGFFTYFFIIASSFSIIPILEVTITDQVKILGFTGFISGIISALFKVRTFLGKEALLKQKWLKNFLFRLCSLFFIFTLFLMAYHVNINLINFPETLTNRIYIDQIIIIIIIFIIMIILGRNNINNYTLGRMYRDRLMEVFLPEDKAVKSNKWEYAKQANKTLLKNMCREEINETGKKVLRKPYHLINANIILFRGKNKRYRNRKGTNFILSPLYCGSDATGYIQTTNFINKNESDKNQYGITLATAMATSGAAINPHAGQAGTGPTSDPFVSFIMTFFNIRLGFWATNPKNGSPQSKPNFFNPGICSLFSLSCHNEDDLYIELSDGGHFENLGIYELIRREVQTIIVSDGGADKNFTFGDLANAIERVRADFNVHIRFRSEQDELGNLIPSTKNENAFYNKYLLANKSFASGTIEYPNLDKSKPKKIGRIYLIKSTLVPNLPGDVYGYRSRYSDFPDQTTGDQFFDENQFEAYRELGYQAAKPLASKLAKEL